MHIAGSRRILAPTRRVRTALHDKAFLQTCLPPALSDHTEIADQTTEQAIAWKLRRGEVKFQLSATAEDFTQLAYDADTDEEDEAALKQAIHTFLDALQSEIAGPRETGADAPLIAAAGAVQSGFPFRAMPNLIFGLPLIFWAGSAVFLFIFVFMFSAYL